ncbi:MAG: glycosyltransferase [Actinomycetota bacterium]
MAEITPISLTYFAPRDVMIPRVARQCIMRFCEALAAAGTDLELVTLGVRLQFDEPTAHRSLWDVYGIRRPFPIRTLWTGLRQDSSTRAVTIARAVRYGAHALRHGLIGRRLARRELNVLFGRNLGSTRALLAVRRRFPGRVLVVLELHGPVSPADLPLLRRLDGLICISDPVAEEAISLGIDPARVMVAHTGVKLEPFEDLATREEARGRLGLAPGRLVVYTGKVHRDSGEVRLLVETARRLSGDVTLLIVGGREDQVQTLRARVASEGPPNVTFEGFVAPADVSLYQAAADALVLYYPSADPLLDYRSPAKLWEYLAAGRPVVSVDSRSLRRILEPDAGVLVPPDDPGALAEALLGVLDDPSRARSLAEAGARLARDHSWDARARQTLAFVERLRSMPRPG